MWPFARRPANPEISVVEVFAKPKNRTVFYEEVPAGEEGEAIKRGMCEAVMQAWETGKATLFTTQVKGRPATWTRILVIAQDLGKAIQPPEANPAITIVVARTADGTVIYRRTMIEGHEAVAFREAMGEAAMKAWDEEAPATVTMRTSGLPPSTVTVSAETEPEGSENPCC